MLLSFIIPIYNVEIFLEKCLDSVVSQNISTVDYEIILINDGSTDNSSAVIEKWMTKNFAYNIQYIIQQNKGLSASRNVGISRAEGKYIMFVDSDDYLFPNVIKNLLDQAIEHNLDALWFDHQLVDINGEVLPLPKEDEKLDVSEEIMSGRIFLTENFKNSCMAWAFLIKKDLLFTENLYFVEGIYFEDIVFTPQMIYNSKRIKFSKIKVYNYMIRDNSIMRDDKNAKKRMMDSLIVVKSLNDFKNKHSDEKLNNYIDTFTGAILLYNYRLSISLNDAYFLKDFKKQMKIYNLFPFKITQPIQRKILAKIANLSPFVFEKLSQFRPIN